MATAHSNSKSKRKSHKSLKASAIFGNSDYSKTILLVEILKVKSQSGILNSVL